MQKDVIKIRAHHGLCFCYFMGKGYSNAFIENMTDVKKRLEENPLVYITTQEDIVCSKCPNNMKGICKTEEKVRKYDKQVLSKCHISDGDILPYENFNRLINQNILQRNQRKEICHDCQWDHLCHDR